MIEQMEDFFHYLKKVQILHIYRSQTHFKNGVVIEAFLETCQTICQGRLRYVCRWNCRSVVFRALWLGAAREGYDVHYIVPAGFQRNNTETEQWNRLKLDLKTNTKLIEVM